MRGQQTIDFPWCLIFLPHLHQCVIKKKKTKPNFSQFFFTFPEFEKSHLPMNALRFS